MLLTLKVNNYLIYNSEIEFSMRANMHYKRFQNNVETVDGVNALKTAVLIGPNNSGKTNFVRVIATLKEIMLGKGVELKGNLFSNNPIAEISISFLITLAFSFRQFFNTLFIKYVSSYLSKKVQD